MMHDEINNQCHLCLSNDLLMLDEFNKLGRATSDCKPWPSGGKLCFCMNCYAVQKIIDNYWRSETKTIYSHYELYHQSTGRKEQPTFNSDTGDFSPRSTAILNYINTVINIKNDSHIIDFGCGVGNMLQLLSNSFSQAKLYGFEPNVHKKQKLTSIRNVAAIYTDTEELKDNHFDLLTMIHVLEHIDHPTQVLKKLKSTIKPGGYFVIVVPDYTENPFDLIITDHATHFSINTLKNLLLYNKLEVIQITNQIINKEIIAICKVPLNDMSLETMDYRDESELKLAHKQINWLALIVKEAKIISATKRPFGIFGTSIAANWIYGELSGNIDFFVDEDQDRVNKLYHGKPVYDVSKIPKNSHTLICLQPRVVKKLIARLSCDDYHFYPTPTL